MKHALLCLLLAGCHDATSVVVSISQTGLSIPAQLASVRIVVDDPDDPTIAPSYVSSDLPLCGAGVTTDCYTLPLSVTLRPGDAQPNATVRVVVTALDQKGAQVTRDAAQFSFTSNQTSRLDFVLSSPCLASDCASLGSTCGIDGSCSSITPGPMTSPDFATTTPSGPITRVYEYDTGFTSPTSTLTIYPSPEVHPHDLMVLIGQGVGATTGWASATLGQYSAILLHVAGATEPASYTFPSDTSGSYALLVYRNVATFDIPFASALEQDPTFPSYAVTTSGSVFLDVIQTQYACTITEGPSDLGPPVPVRTTVASLEQWGPFPAGPSPERSYSATDIAGAARLVLVPQP